MKKHIKLVLFTIFVVVFILSCSQEVTVDSQYYENAEAGTFVVNGRGFATLQAAIDYLNNSRAVGDNDNVIYLTKSTSGPGATISGSNITIDFQNYAFSFTNVTGLQGEDVAGKNFGLTITNGADVNLKGLEEISLYDPDTNLTMIYIEGSSTSLAIEDAPKMVVEDDQYVFWAANGATLTIGSDTATSTEATITGKIAATGTANNKPTVAVKSRSTVSGTIEATSATVNITSSANIVGGVAASASTVTVNTTRSIGTVSATNSSTVTIEGSTTVTSAIEATDSSNITVGGTSTVSGTVTSHSSSSVVFSSSASSDISINKDSGSTITVSAGTVNISGSTGTHSEVERTGGTVTHDTNSGVEVVDQGEIVAIINGRRSIDLADAVNRTSAGGTVTVMNNCSFDTDISISKNLTINTSEYNKTISGTGNFIITQPGVTVTASSSLSSRFKAPDGYKTVSASSGGNVSVHIEVATPYPTSTYSPNQTTWESFNFGTLSVTYKGRGNTTYDESDTMPTSVGTYTAVFTLTDSNSNARKVNVDFVILEGGQSNE